MKERLYLGPTPLKESHSKIGDPRAKIECEAYIHQLKRLFPDATFELEWQNHTLGMYPEIVITYHYYNDTEAKRAFEIEEKLPEYWDEEAQKELRG